MQQIFINADQIADSKVRVTGSDAAHLIKAVRIRVGERLRISTSEGDSYFAEVTEVTRDTVTAELREEAAATEPENRIYLFQAIPKGSRFETVIEKTVELGVYEIIPVAMKHCVVQWDEKKRDAKVKRLQAVAESAAKQSKRSRIPVVHSVMSFSEAVSYANEAADIRLFPYENKDGMTATREALQGIAPGKSVSIFIGPEGGFSEEELKEAEQTMEVISLGRRILRTDTAAIVAVAMVMLQGEV